MYKIIFLIVICINLAACNFGSQKNDGIINPVFKTYYFNSSIRAIEAVDENTCWFGRQKQNGKNDLVKK